MFGFVSFLFVSLCVAVPQKHDYAVSVLLQSENRIPWPGVGGSYRRLTLQQLQQLAAVYYPSLPANQNGTDLALTINDYTSPNFRLYNFYKTARGNATTMAAFITYLDPTQGPHVGKIFGLTGTDRATLAQQVRTQFSRIQSQSKSLTTLLEYALLQTKPIDYSNVTSAPRVLYRGGGRDVPFFCAQFDDVWGVSIDACVANHLGQKGSVFQVTPFWSTTPDPSVIAHFTGNVVYNILPNKANRRAWHARTIRDFSVDPSQNEFLYPSHSTFVMTDAQCVNPSGNNPFWNITLTEAGAIGNKKVFPRPFTKCVSP